MRAEDWRDCPLGPPEGWTQPLRTAIEIALTCPRPVLVVWGQEYIGFPNEAFEALVGPESRAEVGKPCLRNCASLSPALPGALAAAYGGETASVRIENLETGPFEILCVPLRHRTGAVGGAFCLALVERRVAAGGLRRKPPLAVRGANPEHELASKAVRLQAALDAARLGTWEWQPDTDVLSFDARATDIVGAPAPASNAAFERAVHADDRERRRAALESLGRPGAPRRFAAEFRWLCSDGRQIWLEQTGELRTDEPLGSRVVIGTLRDVTERRSSEEALRTASEHKDRFLATLAHELRNPLAPLRYAAELLVSANREDLNWSREVIDRQVAHLSRLIDDLFDISRITREIMGIDKRRVELTEVIQAALESCRPMISQNHQRLIVHLPPEPIYVQGDPVRLTQVVVNLLKNASKFTGSDGRVRVSAMRRGAEAVITVSDTGVGISAEDLPHVFDMFYQGKPSETRPQGGLGIGLYLARRLVELHGGTIRAASEGPGRGSEFVVKLPLCEARDEDAEPAPAAAPTNGGESSCRILVVDDDPDSADALARLLRLIGGEVQTAYDGLAAVDAAEQFHPHVVLLDLDMPRLDGYEACRRLRGQPWAAQARMIALSGWGRREDRERTQQAGFHGHLVKPVGRADVEAILEEWRRSGTRSA